MLTRWDPFAEISRLSGDFFPFNENRRGFAPAVDIFEEKEAIVLKAEVPGMKRDDVQVHVENNILTLRGERALEHDDKRDSYHRVERSYGTFTRSFVLPKSVDAENIGADLSDGVLTLRLPKKAAAEKRRIEVKGS
jgi:HSP20 family protein